MSTEHVWVRYLPGLIAAAGSTAIITMAPPPRRIAFTIWATLLGLSCMEAEYWLAFGFPKSEVTFFVSVVAITLLALATGNVGAMLLGLAGLLFFAYVNLCYGAPYLQDYVMPVLYGLLLARSRRELGWTGDGIWKAGRIEVVAVLALQVLAAWRTTNLAKWGWLAGKHWR